MTAPEEFFTSVPSKIAFEGPESDNPLAFRWYDKDRVVMGKSMEDQLRFGVCYWHSFNWPGSDIFGVGTFDRPWLDPSMEPMAAAHRKWMRRSSSSRSSAPHSSAFTTATSRPREQRSPRAAPISTR